jgi:hypothetical protein
MITTQFSSATLSRFWKPSDAMVCSVWCRAAMDIGQRQPLQERGGTTSTEGTQGQVSFHHGELPVVERHDRLCMQASHTCFSCSANPLVHQGCPRSVGGINTASAFARQLGIDFALLPLDSTPFLRGFGEYCSDSKLTVARWILPVENLDGEDVELEIFLVPGSGPLVLGNSLLHKPVVDRPNDLIEYTDAKGLRVVTPNYFDGVRTRLSVVTTRGGLLQQQQETRRSYLMSLTSRPSSNAKSEKLVFKLHASSRLSARDLEEMCRRAGILSPQLAHYLTLAAHSCISCLRTAKPRPSKKFSLSNVNKEFKNSVQADFFYLDGVDRRTILHAVDTRTSFSMARLCQTTDLELLGSTLSVNGPMFIDHQLGCVMRC